MAQVVFIAAICILIRKDVDKVRFSKLIVLSISMVITYFVGWILKSNFIGACFGLENGNTNGRKGK